VNNLADIKTSLEKQIEVLEKVQQKSLEDGDMQKVQEIAHTIISISNMISNLK
jgi:hypothetical protein